MAVPPPPHDERWHRRYWRSYNRPYPGFGCLYTVILIVLIWFLLSLFVDALVWY